MRMMHVCLLTSKAGEGKLGGSKASLLNQDILNAPLHSSLFSINLFNAEYSYLFSITSKVFISLKLSTPLYLVLPHRDQSRQY